jgi:hypothetical protein
MKKIALLLFAITAQLSFANSQVQLPPILERLKDENPISYITKASQIPPSAIDAAHPAIIWDGKMADKNGGWESIDFITDDSLPRQRLIWATQIKDYIVIHFEKGGYAHSYQFVVISPEDKTGKRSVKWWGYSSGTVSNFKEFIEQVRNGKTTASNDTRWPVDSN